MTKLWLDYPIDETQHSLRPWWTPVISHLKKTFLNSSGKLWTDRPHDGVEISLHRKGPKMPGKNSRGIGGTMAALVAVRDGTVLCEGAQHPYDWWCEQDDRGNAECERLIARVDREFHLPIPPPMPNQVWRYEDGSTTSIPSVRGNGHACFVGGGPFGVSDILYEEWPPALGATLLGGPSIYGKDAQWAPGDWTHPDEEETDDSDAAPGGSSGAPS